MDWYAIITGVAGIDSHICLATQITDDLKLSYAQVPGITHLDGDIIQALRIIIQFILQPGMIGLLIIEIEGAAEFKFFSQFIFFNKR